MSIKAIDRVFDYSRQKGGKLLLLIAIAESAKEDGTGAWPGRDTLAHKTRLDEVYVGVLIDELVAEGELRVHKHRAPNGGDLYDIIYPDTPYTKESFQQHRRTQREAKRAAGKTTAGKVRAKRFTVHKNFLRRERRAGIVHFGPDHKKFLPDRKNFLWFGKNFLFEKWLATPLGAAKTAAEPLVEPLLNRQRERARAANVTPAKRVTLSRVEPREEQKRPPSAIPAPSSPPVSSTVPAASTPSVVLSVPPAVSQVNALTRVQGADAPGAANAPLRPEVGKGEASGEKTQPTSGEKVPAGRGGRRAAPAPTPVAVRRPDGAPLTPAREAAWTALIPAFGPGFLAELLGERNPDPENPVPDWLDLDVPAIVATLRDMRGRHPGRSWRTPFINWLDAQVAEKLAPRRPASAAPRDTVEDEIDAIIRKGQA